MVTKKLVMVIGDDLVNSGIKSPIPLNNSMNLVTKLGSHFNLDDILFYTPSTVLEGSKRAYVLEGSNFKEVGGEVNSDALLIFSVNSNSENFGVEYLRKQFDSYSEMRTRIGRFMNPLESRFLLDKKEIYDRSLSIPLPRRYEFDSWQDLEEIISTQGSCVLKHRFGAEGAQVYKLDKDSFSSIRSTIGEQLGEYMAQEFLDSSIEKRIIVFGDEIVASRIIHSRNHPWDVQKIVKEGYRKELYTPTPEEVEVALTVHRHANMDFSATDFLSDGNTQYYLETNGVCPGLVTRGHPVKEDVVYDLNNRFVKFVYDEVTK